MMSGPLRRIKKLAEELGIIFIGFRPLQELQEKLMNKGVDEVTASALRLRMSHRNAQVMQQ